MAQMVNVNFKMDADVKKKMESVNVNEKVNQALMKK